MPTVVLSAYNVAGFDGGGGHCWVYLQYAHGLRAAGCDVWWLERLDPGGRIDRHDDKLASLTSLLESAGLGDRLIAYTGGSERERRYLNIDVGSVRRVFDRADLLLNFHYGIDPELLGKFQRSALVDIDPGLLQMWLSQGHLEVAPHDVYFTTGETVGTEAARFPDCGIEWEHIRPPVSLDHWPLVTTTPRPCFTTVSAWWGAEWMCDQDGRWYDNNKRATLFAYSRLPARAPVPLELALSTGPGDEHDVALLERRGWRVRNAREVTSTPAAYRRYIQSSRGEFSCAKPSCMRLQNAWVSDRTLCYLASGRPAVVQHTGPSSFLPDDDGLLRFRTPDEAVALLERAVNGYEQHCRAARALAEEFFDARKIAAAILDCALAVAVYRIAASPRLPSSNPRLA